VVTTIRRNRDKAKAGRRWFWLVLAVLAGLAALLALAWARGGPVAMHQISMEVAARKAAPAGWIGG